MVWLLVFAFGGVGAAARYGVGALLPPRGGFPWATLVVNVAGCVAIGVIFTVFEETRALAPPELRAGILAGLLGGFTTFSTFGLETWRLVAEGALGLAATYVAASVLGGLLGVVLGVAAARGLH